MSAIHTKDERFVICLYENAKNSGDLETSFDRYSIGLQAHIQEKGVNTICRLLVQANFIKKQGEDHIYLTPHGVKLAKNLVNEV